MTTSSNNPVRRFFSAAAKSIDFAFKADRLAHTPEDAFKARGTTRQQAIRDLVDQL
ncbi:hypothetical protein [Hoeflea sp. AS16]|uniref:hypothetical protein n=1 Tax=unclassified Hoeflea TaxID=2614931 RepID=UPI0031810A77